MNKEKKQAGNILGLLIPILLIIIVILFLIFLIRYEPINGSSNSVLKNKNYCHSLYNKVYEEVEDKILNHDSTISQVMTDFNFFYSEEKNSCVLAYVRQSTYYDNLIKDKVTDNVYIIKDYLDENNIYYCVSSDRDFLENIDEYANSDKSINKYIENCYDDYKSIVEKLKN